MFKIANEAAPDVRTLRAELPRELARVVALSLVKRPEARYQEGNCFAADLLALIRSSGGTTASSKSSTGPLIPSAPLHAWPMTYDAALPTDHTDAVAAVAIKHRNAAPSRPGSAETDKAL